MLGDGVAQIGVGNFFAVLRGNDHAIDANGAAIAILDGDLGLAVGPEKINPAGLANFREALREAVGELDGHGHQFGGLVASETEHQALVTRAAGIDAHGDVRRLALNGAHDGASLGIEAVFRAVVADAADGVADQRVVVNDARSS